MGIGTSIFLIAAGAILYFAVTGEVTGIDIQTVGLILMIVGVVAFVVGAIYAFTYSRRRLPGEVPPDPRYPPDQRY